MRLLIASTQIIPEHSGGWRSIHDLLGDEIPHDWLLMKYEQDRSTAYIKIWSGEEKVAGDEVGIHNKDEDPLDNYLRTLDSLWEGGHYDLVVTTCDAEALHCASNGIPFWHRFHTVIDNPQLLPFLKKKAKWMTQGWYYYPDVEVLYHGIDFSKYEVVKDPDPTRVIQVCTLNPVEDPFMFFGMIKESDCTGGLVGAGTDPDFQNLVENFLDGNQSVNYYGARTRDEIQHIIHKNNVGVGCAFLKHPSSSYQIKVLEYVAWGLGVIAEGRSQRSIGCFITHQMESKMNPTKVMFPGVTTPKEAADRLRRMKLTWDQCHDLRAASREILSRQFDVSHIRPRVKEKLEEII